MFIIGYFLAIAFLLFLILGLPAALGISCIREANLRREADLPHLVYVDNDDDSEEEFDEPNWREDDVDWEELEQEPQVVYEESDYFVFPRIKTK